MLPRYLLVSVFLLPSWAFGQTASQGPHPTDETIIRKLSQRIRWDWFWTGYTHVNYAEGKKISVVVLESEDETAVFLADLGEYVVFDTEGRITDSLRFPPTTNEAAMEEYLRTYGDAPGPPGQGQHDARTIEQKRAAMTEHSFPFILPKLEPPEAVRRAQAPSGLSEFESAVRTQARDWYDASCGPGQLSIPYFSPDDPVVLVYAELGTCGTGIFDFHLLSNGQWELGRLWPHATPGGPAAALPGADDWSHTIEQIEKHRLATIPVP